MLIANRHPDYGAPLEGADAETLGVAAGHDVERFLAHRRGHQPTPLVSLPGLASELGIASISIKDEGQRLGLGSFKALGGSYAVIRLVLEAASDNLGRLVGVEELETPAVKAVAKAMTFACATDGNHGRSVAQGAQVVGSACAIFVHRGVSEERIAAIALFGAAIVRVDGTYDDSVAEAARVANERGWITVSDTSWPGYERIPCLVMQGYAAIVSEALRELPENPTHVFVQAGVGGVAAALAGHLSIRLGEKRPFFTVVDPARAACLFASAKAGHPMKIPAGEPTIMAMLECYEPSLVAWRILARAADAFMTVEDDEALAVMKRLASPLPGDPAIVAGESGGVGLAGLIQVAASEEMRTTTGLGRDARVFLVNTEGATDPKLYQRLVGVSPAEVAARNPGHAREAH